MSTALRLTDGNKSLTAVGVALPYECTLSYLDGSTVDYVASMQGDSGLLVPEIKPKPNNLPTIGGKALFAGKELVEIAQ